MVRDREPRARVILSSFLIGGWILLTLVLDGQARHQIDRLVVDAVLNARDLLEVGSCFARV